MSTGMNPPVCHDCHAKPGEPHDDGCDTARCLQTGGQRLACAKRHDHGRDIWTGMWPGEAECREFGWFSRFTERGWERCAEDAPGAGPDLNRLRTGEAQWDRKVRRWVLPRARELGGQQR